jgi:signal transduction histidine kinase
MTRRSLRFRLLAAAAGSIALALLVAGLGLTALFERHVERRLETQLDDNLGQILAHLKATPDGRVLFDLALADPRFQTPLSGLYWQIQDQDRPTLLRSRSLWDAVLTLPGDTLADGALHRHDLVGPGGQALLAVERQVVFRPESEGRRLRVAVALDRQELTQARRAFAADMAPYLVLLGAVLMVSAWVQVRVGLAPLDAVRQGLKSIRSGAARRLPADYPDEVVPLVEEFNALLDGRDGAIERARAWTADLAHGLKTPLVVLAADAQRLRDAGQPELADDLDGLAQTMRKRVDRELIRARIRARIPARIPVQNAAQPPAQGDPPGFRGGAGLGAADLGADLPATLDRVVRTLQRTPTGSRLLWDLDGPEALRVPMLSEDLMELLGNVLENAATWAASRVVVRVSAADPVVVRVEDDGPGVPEGALEVLGQRGLRLDERIPGSGLGLAIAQDICDAYGAELAFGHGAQGPGSGGLVVTLSLSAGGNPH